MSKWDDVRPGQPVIDKLERDIAAWKEHRSRQRSIYLGIVLVILTLLILFTGFEVELPR